MEAILKRAAILGAGFISHSHAEALRYCGIELYAIVDTSIEAAKTFAQTWNIPKYSTTDELLFEDSITTVHVCTPPNTHYEVVKKLLHAGKHVLCEKPLCYSNKEAEELKELAAAKGLMCAINLNVRFHSMSLKMKEIVQQSTFGKVLLLHGKYLQQFHMMPTPYGWRYIPEMGGMMRAVTEIGTHWFDIIQYVTGDKISAVSALFGNFHPKRRLKEGMMYPLKDDDNTDEIVEVSSEDAALISFRMHNGAIGSVVLSEVSQGYSNYLQYEITGTNMTIGWNSQNNNELYYNNETSSSTIIKDGFGNGFDDTFRSLIHSFYAKGKDEVACPTFEEGANIVKLCNAVYESATQKSKWIEIK